MAAYLISLWKLASAAGGDVFCYTKDFEELNNKKFKPELCSQFTLTFIGVDFEGKIVDVNGNSSNYFLKCFMYSNEFCGNKCDQNIIW